MAAAIVVYTCACSHSIAQYRIGIDLRPTSDHAEVGDVIDIQILAVRQTDGSLSPPAGQAFNVIDLFFAWSPQDLRLISASGPGSAGTAPQLISSGFVSPHVDYTGTNEVLPPADGTAYYNCISVPPVYSTLQGTLVATLSFQVLRDFPSTAITPIPSVAVPGSDLMEHTKVLDASVPGLNCIGSLSGATISAGPPHPCRYESDLQATVNGTDEDGDGYCSTFSLGTDCDDQARDVYPSAGEVCGNAIDNNCDGRVDEAAFLWYADMDGDGIGAGPLVELCDSYPPSGFSALGSDNCPHVYNPAQADCDSDGIGDACALDAGAPDLDGNGVPDSCQCIADLFVDGAVGGPDLAVVLSQWGYTSYPVADINVDGSVDGKDLAIVLVSWGPCQ